eukprot:51392_1
MHAICTLLMLSLYMLGAQPTAINNADIQRLLNRIQTQNQNNALNAALQDANVNNIPNQGNQNNVGNANTVNPTPNTNPVTVLDPRNIDDGNHDAIIGPASLAQRSDEFAFTTTFQPTVINAAEDALNTNIPVDLTGAFFLTRFAECEELQCGESKQECCIDNVHAFCCIPSTINSDSEGRFSVGAIGVVAGVGGITRIVPVGPIAALITPNLFATTTFTPIQNLELQAILLSEGQICFVDTDCAFGLICEMDAQCVISAQFRNFGLRGRRNRRGRRRNRLSRFGSGVICHKVCSVGFR